MKKLLKFLLTVLIAIIVIIIAVLIYVIVKNPFGMGDIIKASIVSREVVVDSNTNANYDHPLLNEEQEARLIKTGVDLKKIPTEITPEQQQCGIDKLGKTRIMEIINGADPSPLEIIKVLPCL